VDRPFITHQPRQEDYWRGFILFGRNVASYKLALAQALPDLRPSAGRRAPLEELAGPYSAHLCRHQRHATKQGDIGTKRAEFGSAYPKSIQRQSTVGRSSL